MHDTASAPIPGPVASSLEPVDRVGRQTDHTLSPTGSPSGPGFQSFQNNQNGRSLGTGGIGHTFYFGGDVNDTRRDDSFLNVIGTGNHVHFSFHGESSFTYALIFVFLFVGSFYVCVSGIAARPC